MASKRVRLTLGSTQASVLLYAARSIVDDIDHIGLTRYEKNALLDALAILRTALKEAQR